MNMETMTNGVTTSEIRSRAFVFTTNNYTPELYEEITKYLSTDKTVTYAVCGKEISSSGTPHLQGYVKFKNNKTRAQVSRKIKHSFIDNAKGGDPANRKYCTKDGDYVEYGIVHEHAQGKRTDLDIIQEKIKGGANIKQIADEHFSQFVQYGRAFKEYSLMHMTEYQHDDVRGVWIYGPPGTGKSHCVRQFAAGQQLQLFNKPQNKWFDGYVGQEVMLLDDLDTEVLGHYLKIWSDKYACTGETKGGTVPLRHQYLVITSNYPPSHFWPDDGVMCAAIERRFLVQEKRRKEQVMNFTERTVLEPVFKKQRRNEEEEEGAFTKDFSLGTTNESRGLSE